MEVLWARGSLDLLWAGPSLSQAALELMEITGNPGALRQAAEQRSDQET